MPQQITGSFTITIKGKPNNYTIEATGPKNIQVDPHPFTWPPTPEQEATISALVSEKSPVRPDAIRELGKALHNAVFTPPVATAFGHLL